MQYFKGLEYLWMLGFIMIIAGIAKEYNLFASVYTWIKNTFKHNRIVVVLISAIGGALPISGRVTVSAGLLDTIAPKEGKARHKFGIIDYISTHHYYMWSPLEKTVIVSLAVLGITFTEWLEMVWPLILGSLVLIFWYMWFKVDESEINITPTEFSFFEFLKNVVPMIAGISAFVYGLSATLVFGTLAIYYIVLNKVWDIKKLHSYLNYEVLLVVVGAIILGNFFKSYESEFQEYLREMTDAHILAISAVGFVFSFLMGSSGKFVALAAIMATVFGIEYFVWFFAVDYAGYLLSPTHKCVLIGNRYFGTPFGMYYKVLVAWVVILISIAGMLTFVI